MNPTRPISNPVNVRIKRGSVWKWRESNVHNQSVNHRVKRTYSGVLGPKPLFPSPPSHHFPLLTLPPRPFLIVILTQPFTPFTSLSLSVLFLLLPCPPNPVGEHCELQAWPLAEPQPTLNSAHFSRLWSVRKGMTFGILELGALRT